MTSVAARRRSGPDPGASLLAVGSLALLASDVWAVSQVPHVATRSIVVRDFVFASSWLVVGLVAMGLGRAMLARRILTLSTLLAADVPGGLILQGESFLARVLVTVSTALVPLHLAAATHLVISFPTGKLDSRASRRVVAITYALAASQGAWWTLTDAEGTVCRGCADAPALIQVSPFTHQVVVAALGGCFLVAALFICWRIVCRYRDAGQRQRRLLRIPYAASLVGAVLYGFLAMVGRQTGEHVYDTRAGATVAEAVALIVPLSILVALVSERLSYKRIGELVVARAGRTDTDLEGSLAIALGDPQLRLVFPVDDGYVDSQGRRTTAPAADARATLTTVGEMDAPLAVIRHDRSLSEEPALLMAAGSATRLILENARLQAEVRAQLLEVRESRTRIVTATNEARARLERDLHDGAQQRLLAIGIALQLLRQQPGDPTLLEAAESELSSALAEMRELASGIHPAVLTDLGLVAALEALAGRLGPRVRLDVPGPVRRCSPEVEAAAYFSATEAITNALKHAAPSPVDVTVVDRDNRLVVRVHDDGPGGADVTGSGLLGVRDRLAAVDGTLTVASPYDCGTELRMEVPCA